MPDAGQTGCIQQSKLLVAAVPAWQLKLLELFQFR